METYMGWLLGVVLVACGSPQEAPELPLPHESSEEQSANAPEEAAAAETVEPDSTTLPLTIDGLVERFDGSYGLWLNGLYPTLELPETASTQAVLEAMFGMVSFDQGRVSEFRIFEERVVRIDEEAFSALRVTTNQGPKIVLMRYRSPGWWTRIYEGTAP